MREGAIREGTFFGESRVRRLGVFSKELFAGKLGGWEGARTYGEVARLLENCV